MFIETEIINPFPGLRAFEEDEDVLFFGREKQVDELVTKLRTSRFISVIGSSGSGKSSLVKSGLIPALQSGFMSRAGSSWHIISFRPGNNPIGNMAKALVRINGGNQEDDNLEDAEIHSVMNESVLRRSSNGLVESFKQLGLSSTDNLLILVDQFEEIFRFSKFESESKEVKRDSVAFINLLIKATKQLDVPIYVVITMRSDFLSDCTEFRGLPEVINDGNYLVPRMTREERKDAITGPILVANAKISQRLLNLLLNDVGDNPDQLPILQHSLMRTWELWKKKNQNDAVEIDIVDYEAIGTMKHALSQHAEEAYAELKDDKQRRICEIVFKSLTDKGSDVRGIRRPRLMSELCEISNASFEEVEQVINVFRKVGRGFLMPPINVPLTNETIIDISHESIMRVWVKLINWLEEENQSSLTYLRLCEAANLYELGIGGLWHDPELQVALKWKNDQNPNTKWASRYNNDFEKAMLFLSHSKKQFEQEILNKENLQKRRLKQAKRISIIISGFGILAVFLAILSYDARQKANIEKENAKKQEKIALVQSKIANQNKIIALQEKDKAEQNRTIALKEKENAEIERSKAVTSEKNALTQKRIAEDQKTYAEKQKIIAEENAKIASEQKSIALTQKDLATKNLNIAIEQKRIANRFTELSESSNLANQSILLLNEGKFKESKELVLKAYDMNIKNSGPIQNEDIYNALNLIWQKSMQNRNRFNIHKYPIRSIITKPNTNIVISSDESGIIIISKSNGGVLQPIKNFSIKKEIRFLSFSPNGQKLLVLTASGEGLIYGFDEQKQSFPLLTTIKFDGIGKMATFLNNSELLILTNLGIQQLKIVNNNAQQISFINGKTFSNLVKSPSGKIYLSDDDKIKVYNSVENLSKQPNQVYKLGWRITSIDIDSNEKYLAAGSSTGIIWLSDISSNSKPVTIGLHQSAINDLKFGKQQGNTLELATAGADHLVKLVDVSAALSDKKTVFTLWGHGLWVYALCFSSDGKYLFSSSEDQEILSWIPLMSDLHEELIKNK
jgi:energy-coupling factor transporter ATP-binding protein EcfA2